MTKHVSDDLKCHLTLEDAEVEVKPEVIDNTLVIARPHVVHKPESSEIEVRIVKAKMTTKKSNLEKATSHLYDLEGSHGPEKCIDIDLGLYQMEDY